uniref:Uncharacterized protein n=1 Tax=Arundo donax TaxID=35708 RepID=A0A0A8YPW8_ARUDO
MESRPALASVVVVVSNTCPPTLNRTRPPPAIGVRQRTNRSLHHPRAAREQTPTLGSIQLQETGGFRGESGGELHGLLRCFGRLGRRIGLAPTRVHGRG